jgi:hypothetical protein
MAPTIAAHPYAVDDRGGKQVTKTGDGKQVTAAHIGEPKLPYKATQFRFERSLLPSLYDLLDALGSV